MEAAAPAVDRLVYPDGRALLILDRGGCINCTAGEGNPIEIMDLSFGVQFFSALHLLQHHAELKNEVYLMPEEINTKLANIKLAALGVRIDELTPEQRRYLNLE